MKKNLLFSALILLVGCIDQKKEEPNPEEQDNRRIRLIRFVDLKDDSPVNNGYGKDFPVWKVGDYVYAAGGSDFPSLYVVSVKDNTSKLTSTLPHFSRGAAAWISGSNLYLWGGVNHTGRIFSSEMWEYNTSKKLWTKINTSSGPSARSHSTIWESETTVWLMGGHGADPKSGVDLYFNDLWKWDKKTKKWEEIKITGKSPSSRTRGNAWIQNEALWLYGGFYNDNLYDMWSFDGKSWSSQNDNPNPVTQLTGNVWPGKKHSSHCLTSPQGLWMWGGNTYSSQRDFLFWIWDKTQWRVLMTIPAMVQSDSYTLVFLENDTLKLIPLPHKKNFRIHKAAVEYSPLKAP